MTARGAEVKGHQQVLPSQGGVGTELQATHLRGCRAREGQLLFLSALPGKYGGACAP